MISIPVTEASQVGDVRRRATAIAQRLGFDEVETGRVAIVATELATNLVKYGSDGEVLLGDFEDDGGAGVQVVALDRGAGFSDVGEALRDGHSSGGTAGTGLGSVRRQSDEFDIVSWPARGVAVVARLRAESSSTRSSPDGTHRFGAITVPLRGEIVCGDAYCARARGDGWTVLLADGLGHGIHAAEAADEAVRIFRRQEQEGPGRILAAIHAGLKHTRGGAVSVARYQADRQVLIFAGIGNVAGAVVAGGEIKRTVSLSGTAGHVARRIQEFEYPFSPEGLFVMHSDGIATSWALDRYPGLVGAHPTLVAAILYRDFARGRDDASVLVARGRMS